MKLIMSRANYRLNQTVTASPTDMSAALAQVILVKSGRFEGIFEMPLLPRSYNLFTK
jgi:hypothetical protein